MKKKKCKKLSLSSETIRSLDPAVFRAVPGGMQNVSQANPCFSALPSCYCTGGTCASACGTGCVTDDDMGCAGVSYDACHPG